MISLLTGFLSVRALTSGPRFWCRHDFFRLVLGAALGIGLCSICFFVSLLSGIPPLALELILLLAAGAAVALRWKKAVCPFCDDRAGTAPDPAVTAALAGALAVMLLLDGLAFATTTQREPNGGWDAVAIWNLRAHFLYRGSDAGWRDGFTNTLEWSHPDYPLLLPAFIARTWKTIGRETHAVPIGTAFFFTFGTTAMMAAFLSLLRGVRQGLVGALVLAATPILYVQGAIQYADVPLGFFILATLGSMALAGRLGSAGFAALAGAFAALAGWTKNEGLLWLAAFLLARLMVDRWRLLPPILAGAAPAVGAILLFKARVATSSDIFGPAARVGMGQRLLDPERYLLIAMDAVRHLWEFGPLLLSPFLILAAYLLVVGVQPEDRDPIARRTSSVALRLLAAGYFMIYVVHPNPLPWELSVSLSRLLLQIWPGIVFSVFLSSNPISLPLRPSAIPALYGSHALADAPRAEKPRTVIRP